MPSENPSNDGCGQRIERRRIVRRGAYPKKQNLSKFRKSSPNERSADRADNAKLNASCLRASA
jgi:hypothetical protein